MGRLLFICSTQYHLLNCIRIASEKSKKSKKDVLILNFNNGLNEKINYNSLAYIFDNIFHIDVCKMSDSKTKKAFCIMSLLLNSSKDYFNNKYNQVFISGTEIYSKIIAMKLWKKGTSIFYFDDGLASYESVLNKESKFKQDTIFKVIYTKRPLEVCSGLYVYKPDLVVNNSFKTLINKIKIADDIVFCQEMKDIFTDEIKPFNKKIVFLTAWFNESRYYKEQINYIDTLANLIPGEYCVKLHPSDLRKELLLKYTIEECGNFELTNICYNMKNMVYISIISTACLTPDIMTSNSYTIIFMYKIFMKKYDMPTWEDVDKVIGKYISKSCKSRIYIPESMEEFIKIIKDCSEKQEYEN